MSTITCQPHRLSMKYSPGKDEEDLIKSDESHPEPNGDKQNNTEDENHDRVLEYKENNCCDYMVNICHCTSWLCANLVYSLELCFENCIEFITTCKCNAKCCCNCCGGSEDSVENNTKIADNVRFSDLSASLEEGCVACEDVSGEYHMEIDEVVIDISNDQNQSVVPENVEKTSL